MKPYLTRDQGRRFVDADEERTAWIEQVAPVRRHEEIVHRQIVVEGGPILEVGAGEGLLMRMRPDLRVLRYVGTDLHASRCRSLKRDGTATTEAVACDASRLPFARGAFRSVVCRDLLHHLEPETRRRAVHEMARVLVDDGVATILEPNAARSPVIAAFSLAIPTERMALTFHAGPLRALLSEAFHEVTVDHLEPSLLYRALYHHRLGAPGLARVSFVRRAVEAWESVAQMLPSDRWGIVRLVCRRPRRA